MAAVSEGSTFKIDWDAIEKMSRTVGGHSDQIDWSSLGVSEEEGENLGISNRPDRGRGVRNKLKNMMGRLTGRASAREERRASQYGEQDQWDGLSDDDKNMAMTKAFEEWRNNGVEPPQWMKDNLELYGFWGGGEAPRSSIQGGSTAEEEEESIDAAAASVAGAGGKMRKLLESKAGKGALTVMKFVAGVAGGFGIADVLKLGPGQEATAGLLVQGALGLTILGTETGARVIEAAEARFPRVARLSQSIAGDKGVGGVLRNLRNAATRILFSPITQGLFVGAVVHSMYEALSGYSSVFHGVSAVEPIPGPIPGPAAAKTGIPTATAGPESTATVEPTVTVAPTVTELPEGGEAGAGGQPPAATLAPGGEVGGGTETSTVTAAATEAPTATAGPEVTPTAVSTEAPTAVVTPDVSPTPAATLAPGGEVGGGEAGGGALLPGGEMPGVSEGQSPGEIVELPQQAEGGAVQIPPEDLVPPGDAGLMAAQDQQAEAAGQPAVVAGGAPTAGGEISPGVYQVQPDDNLTTLVERAGGDPYGADFTNTVLGSEDVLTGLQNPNRDLAETLIDYLRIYPETTWQDAINKNLRLPNGMSLADVFKEATHWIFPGQKINIVVGAAMP